MKSFIIAVVSVTLLGLAGCSAAAKSDNPGIKPFTFVQLCDPQLGFGGYEHDVDSFKQAVQRINALKPDFVVICGDLVHTFDAKSLADFNEIRSGLRMPCYLAPGNHDLGDAPTAASLNRYHAVLGKDTFSFQHKGYTFVVANSSLWKAPLEEESQKQDSWLRQTLKAARDANSPVFVVQHIPLYGKSPDEVEDRYYNLPVTKRKELLALIEDGGVVAVLAGHRHETVVNNYRGIQLVTGETTSKNNDRRPLGFRLWRVESPTSIKHEFVPLTPTTSVMDVNGDERVNVEVVRMLGV